MRQLKFLERRLNENDTLRKCYQDNLDADVKLVYVCKVEQFELNNIIDKLQWYLPLHPVINLHKPKEVRRVCNATVKYQAVALEDKFFSVA